MPTKIIEFHGYLPLTPEGRGAAAKRWCPFIDDKCKKSQSGGACSLQGPNSAPVIICPNRLYDSGFYTIRRVAEQVFGPGCELVTDLVAEARRQEGMLTGNEVVVYGQGWSGEIGIKAPTAEGETGTFKVDFLLASVNQNLEPVSIVAIEVQTIDTTDSYKSASMSYYAEQIHYGRWGDDSTKAGFNWENVTKRILPQIIYKGHALRREKLASHGLFFIVPEPVLQKIRTRIGSNLLEYPRGPGTITFHSYQLGSTLEHGRRSLEVVSEFTTTVEQIAFAFVSPQNLPPLGIYEDTISAKLQKLRKRKRLNGPS